MSGTNPSGTWNGYPAGALPMTGNEQFLATQSTAAGAATFRYPSSAVAAGPVTSLTSSIYLMTFLPGKGRPDGNDCTAAMLACIAAATANSLAGLASNIILPAGVVALGTVAASIIVPSNTTISGQGMDATTVTWNDASGTFALFQTSGTTTNLAFNDFTVAGSVLTNGYAPTCAAFLLFSVTGLRFERMRCFGSRGYGMAARVCIDVKVTDCEAIIMGVTGISCVACALVEITGNELRHSGDDSIDAHSQPNDPWVVRRDLIIANNRIFDGQGISVLSARNCIITNNVLDCVRGIGIYVGGLLGGSATEGRSAAESVVIANNVITNVLNPSVFNPGDENSAIGISVEGSAAKPGLAGTIPGERNPADNTILGSTKYFQSNSVSANIATSGAHGFVITGNVVARTLPACDGTATSTGGTNKTYNNFVDFGLADAYSGGQIWTRNGWKNPSLTETQMRFIGAAITYGVVRDVLFSNNHLRGLATGVQLAVAEMADIQITNNTMFDCVGVGGVALIAGTNQFARIYVTGNFFDLDPYLKAPTRLASGAWNTATPPLYPAGVWIQSGFGVVVQRNRFRNVLTTISTNVADSVQASDNWAECQLPVTNSPLPPLGIARIDASCTVLNVICDPTSATYGQMIGMPVGPSFSTPSTGWYAIGAYVPSVIPKPDANGNILVGWRRLTNGSNNVLGTDWETSFESNVSRDYTALPVSGASDGTVKAIAVAIPPGTFQYYNDGTATLPTVTLDAPPGGGVQATGTVSTIFCADGATITPTTTVSAAGTIVTLVVNPGSGFSPGDVLVPTGAMWTTPRSGTVDSVGTAGNITQLHFPSGLATNFPANPVTFTGGGGAGFTCHMALWGVSTIGVTAAGYYPGVTPAATMSAGTVNTGVLTVQMNESAYMDVTGLHLNRGMDRKTKLVALANGGTITLTGTGDASLMIQAGSSLAAGTLILPTEANFASGVNYEQIINATDTITALTLVSPGTLAIHASFSGITPAAAGKIVFHSETTPKAWFPL